MTTEQRQLEAEELASSLSETLSLNFPQGSPAHDEKLVKRWLRELAEATASNDTTDGSDMANEIMQLAVEKWKARDPRTIPESTKTTATSFSLLDQLSAMPKRVFFDEIEGASTPTERLQLLQQVDHVDDVASDWNKVLEMLFQGLTESDYPSDYVQLHRKWFDQRSNSSAEYISLQFGLCSNLVKALRQFFGTFVFVSVLTDGFEFTADQQLVFEIMQQWHAMWVSAMKNFRVDDANQMARDMMQLMRNLAPATPSKFVLLPAHFMALVDPYANWFALWIGHGVSPSDALNNLLSTGLLYELMGRLASQGHIQWKGQSNVVGTTFILLQKGQDVQVSQLERALWVQALSIIRSILVRTRVVLFPWKELLAEEPTQVLYTILLDSSPAEKESFNPVIYDADSVDRVMMVLDYYMEVISNPTSEAKLTAVCCEALETILLGLRDDENLRNALRAIVDRTPVTTLTVAAARDLMSLLFRVHQGKDWTDDKETPERLAAFLKILREHSGLASVDP